MTTLTIIQARMGSSRLPGKSLMDLAGRPVILHLVARAEAAVTVDRVAVATTVAPVDDPLVALLEARGVTVVRGAEDDVLGRYVQAVETLVPADERGTMAVVRLTGDDPLKDPKSIDAVVSAFTAEPGRWDYVCNNQPPWLPEGQDVEVVSGAALLAAGAEATDPYEREHVTPFFYRHPNRFRCFSVQGTPDISTLRWTLDTAADLAFLRRVFAELPGNRMPGVADVLALLREKPEIAEINANVLRSHLYRSDDRTLP